MAFGAPFPGGGVVNFSLVSTAGGGATVSNPVTFGMAFGAEAPNRYLVAAVGIGHTGASATSVTIGGVAATQVVNVDDSFIHASLWIALVPTATSGNLTVASSGGVGGVIDSPVALYAMTGNRSATADVIATSTSTSASINAPGGGAVIACAFAETGGNQTPPAWTGLSGDFVSNLASNAVKMSSASAQIKIGGSLNVSCSIGNNALPALAIAAWGP